MNEYGGFIEAAETPSHVINTGSCPSGGVAKPAAVPL